MTKYALEKFQITQFTGCLVSVQDIIYHTCAHAAESHFSLPAMLVTRRLLILKEMTQYLPAYQLACAPS